MATKNQISSNSEQNSGFASQAMPISEEPKQPALSQIERPSGERQWTIGKIDQNLGSIA